MESTISWFSMDLDILDRIQQMQSPSLSIRRVISLDLLIATIRLNFFCSQSEWTPLRLITECSSHSECETLVTSPALPSTSRAPKLCLANLEREILYPIVTKAEQGRFLAPLAARRKSRQPSAGFPAHGSLTWQTRASRQALQSVESVESVYPHGSCQQACTPCPRPWHTPPH
jgi:hypothetical protein